MENIREKRKLQQPPSSYADCVEASTDENIGKDFATLINAPLSKGGHFIFKSEKDWSSIDTSSQYLEFFTLKLNSLSAAIDCIPFNEYIDVDSNYFISDQLMSIHNKAEERKEIYEEILNIENTTMLLDAVLEEKKKNNNIINQSKELESTQAKLENNIDVEDDIDFLLSLTEPIKKNAPTVSLPVIETSNSLRPKNILTKSVDLEQWLDSVLND